MHSDKTGTEATNKVATTSEDKENECNNKRLKLENAQ